MCSCRDKNRKLCCRVDSDNDDGPSSSHVSKNHFPLLPCIRALESKRVGNLTEFSNLHRRYSQRRPCGLEAMKIKLIFSWNYNMQLSHYLLSIFLAFCTTYISPYLSDYKCLSTLLDYGFLKNKLF